MRVRTSTLMLAIFIPAFTAFLVSAFMLDADNSIAVLRLGCVTVSVGVVAAFYRAAIEAITSQDIDAASLLSLGIFLKWIGTLGLSSWHLMWRLADKPEWMLDSEAHSIFMLLIVIGGIFHMLSPNAIGGVIPRENSVRVGAIFGLTAFMFFGLLWVQDIFPAIADALEPILGDND